jgi:hypothetical protein
MRYCPFTFNTKLKLFSISYKNLVNDKNLFFCLLVTLTNCIFNKYFRACNTPSIVSPNFPIPVLHDSHNQPLKLSVVWQWSRCNLSEYLLQHWHNPLAGFVCTLAKWYLTFWLADVQLTHVLEFNTK